MSKTVSHDPSALLAAAYAVAETDVTAAGTGDATEVSTAWIDVTECESVVFALAYTTTLADTESLSISGNLQEATDASGTGAADYGDAIASTTIVTSSGGTTETGVMFAAFDVSATDGFVRFQFTPNLSASGTDTAKIQCLALLGGHKQNPPVRTGLTRLN